MAKLTTRQREILRLLAKGRSQKEIAYALGIRPATVRSQMGRARARTQMRSTLEMACRALEDGSL